MLWINGREYPQITLVYGSSKTIDVKLHPGRNTILLNIIVADHNNFLHQLGTGIFSLQLLKGQLGLKDFSIINQKPATLRTPYFLADSTYPTGLGDYFTLLKEAVQATFMQGQPGIMGGINGLQRYLFYDLSSTAVSGIDASNNLARSSVSIDRPYGTIVSINDYVPAELVQPDNTQAYSTEVATKSSIPDNGSLIDNFLHAGGKIMFASGGIPFSQVAIRNQITLPPSEGSLGHQKIFGIINNNENGGTLAGGVPGGFNINTYYDQGLYVNSTNNYSTNNINNTSYNNVYHLENNCIPTPLNNFCNFTFSSNNPLTLNNALAGYGTLNNKATANGVNYISSASLQTNPDIIAYWPFDVNNVVKLTENNQIIKDISANHNDLNVKTNGYTIDQAYLGYYFDQYNSTDTFTLSPTQLSQITNAMTMEFTIDNGLYSGQSSGNITLNIGNLNVQITGSPKGVAPFNVTLTGKGFDFLSPGALSVTNQCLTKSGLLANQSFCINTSPTLYDTNPVTEFGPIMTGPIRIAVKLGYDPSFYYGDSLTNQYQTGEGYPGIPTIPISTVSLYYRSGTGNTNWQQLGNTEILWNTNAFSIQDACATKDNRYAGHTLVYAACIPEDSKSQPYYTPPVVNLSDVLANKTISIVKKTPDLISDIIIYKVAKQYEINSKTQMDDLPILQTQSVNPLITYTTNSQSFNSIINYSPTISTVINDNTYDIVEITSQDNNSKTDSPSYYDNLTGTKPISYAYHAKGVTAVVDTNGSRSQYMNFPSRYTSPSEQGLYSYTFASDPSSAYQFIDQRPYLSLFTNNLVTHSPSFRNPDGQTINNSTTTKTVDIYPSQWMLNYIEKGNSINLVDTKNNLFNQYNQPVNWPNTLSAYSS